MKKIAQEFKDYSVYDWLIIAVLLLVVSIIFNIHFFFKKPEIKEVENDAKVEHYRSVIKALTAHNNYLGAKLSETPQTLTKIKIKHEKSIDTVFVYSNSILDSVFKSEFKRYDSIRKTFSIARFTDTIR